jgi:hypothetical protein
MRGFAKGPLKTYPVSLEGHILLVRLQ